MFSSPEVIQSGQGFVHNSLFFENVHKSVLRAPFVMPLRIKLPYHTTFKNLLAYAQAYAAYETYGGVWNLGRFLMYNVLG
ncbi:hypothetical protein SARC_11513 [Sphaeroforma arctica JP610]|uniref:Uncharacterized protein n=1 Tax=Sphaeroforma arctica JP610 TaxID=667725 RepID=A0A0L0FGR8_9EUKA|nr:hypothetical protein SARC_11513 [Sphaeroforma arctica JP610]KNC75974.1 hypothetical protein SARC_11513 [Sphaeroforma arctica JP610]|eukprot:XP_014149876.1 hypothetical protein SARC_11513 [Sphaeroforma arctica JP610]